MSPGSLRAGTQDIRSLLKAQQAMHSGVRGQLATRRSLPPRVAAPAAAPMIMSFHRAKGFCGCNSSS